MAKTGDNVTLMEYLSLPDIPVDPPYMEPNTTNYACSYNINVVADWKGFSLNTILEHYKNILDGEPDFLEILPVNSDGSLAGPTPDQMEGLSVLSFDVGKSAEYHGDFVPDAAFYARDLYPSGPNRAPGKYVLHWKWNSPLKYQVLSETNDYMRIHRTRYGFMLTDREMGAIRRVDE
ncbi:hypothetical protein VTN00DRAFT_3408 [Thermoascus crustaceus]|uniref:uncharacterized protein n=1 Tax=Thermoascus crustaceus TaxID=5088 RepID=UPI00374261BB